jgi:hypothetical protein
VKRDTVLLVVGIVTRFLLLGTGIVGALHEEFSGHPNPWLITLYGSMITTPGALGVATVRKYLGRTQESDSSQESLRPPSQQPSSPSS